MPLNHILWKCKEGYQFIKSKEKMKHVMSLNDFKIFAKDEKELESIIQTLRIYN